MPRSSDLYLSEKQVAAVLGLLIDKGYVKVLVDEFGVKRYRATRSGVAYMMRLLDEHPISDSPKGRTPKN